MASKLHHGCGSKTLINKLTQPALIGYQAIRYEKVISSLDSSCDWIARHAVASRNGSL
jgi:pyruvate-formate lyase